MVNKCVLPKHVWKKHLYIVFFQKIGVPENGWFLMEDTIKIDDLEGTPTLEIPI